MSEKIISSDEADLLIHRFVTERIPVVVWFLSADKSVNFKLTGFVTSSTREKGMYIAAAWPMSEDQSVPTYGNFTGLSGCICSYADETEVPRDFEFGSGLSLKLPNGDILVVMEQR